jgi:hypothetical protein
MPDAPASLQIAVKVGDDALTDAALGSAADRIACDLAAAILRSVGVDRMMTRDDRATEPPD